MGVECQRRARRSALRCFRAGAQTMTNPQFKKSINERFSLAGRTAFVTGASSGIGRHAALLFAEAGASVIVAARRLQSLEDLVETLRLQGHRACALPLDVTEPETIDAALQKGAEEMGAIPDLLLNNAGVLIVERFVAQTRAQVDQVIDTNLKGSFAVAQAFAKQLVDAGVPGTIINVSSTSALRAGGLLASYAASKAALMQLGRIMALELAPQGIRVNNICPGNVRTDMQARLSALESTLVKRTPMRRFGDVDDLSGALLLLASDAGRYITGADLVVDGGQTLTWM